MKVSHIEMILFVADLARCRDFYKSLLQIVPVTDVPGMVELELAKNFKLGLMPLEGIGRIVGEETIRPKEKDIPPRGELYLLVEDPEDVFSRALALGAKALSPVQERNWGHKAGYVSDPEGNIIAFAGEL